MAPQDGSIERANIKTIREAWNRMRSRNQDGFSHTVPVLYVEIPQELKYTPYSSMAPLPKPRERVEFEFKSWAAYPNTRLFSVTGRYGGTDYEVAFGPL